MRRLAGLIVTLCLAAATLSAASGLWVAAGTVTSTVSDVGNGVTRITLAWTSSSGGDVSGHAFAVPTGELLQAKFVPGATTAQPSDLYDVTLVDSNAVDVLATLGGNLSNSTSSIVVPRASTNAARFLLDRTQTLDLVVANAGNAKSGTVTLWIGR